MSTAGPTSWPGPPPVGESSRSRLYLRHVAQRLFDLRRRVLVVLELAGQERLVRAEVEVAVAGEVEQDRLALACFLATECLIARDPDPLAGPRPWAETLSTSGR